MSKMPLKENAGVHGKPPVQRFKPGTIKRLLSYMTEYRIQLIFVVVCILLSAVATASTSLFLQILIDKCIVPLLGQAHPVFTELIKAISVMGLIYAVGILSTLFYNRAMVVIAQETHARGLRGDGADGTC